MVAIPIATTSTGAQANSKYSGIVVDAKTGKTLYQYKADTPRYPASLTKIMTLYIVFEELEAGRLTMNSRLKVSKWAAGRPPSKLGLKAGSTIKVKDAVLALITKSANDAAATIAENISGSESSFARRMTATARQIGMRKTTFKNAHGLPNSGQRTTARDMATLGRAIQERFPSYYKLFQTRSYTYKGRRYGNHNKLLGRVKGVDGIKTGYIRASGFNLVTSVKRDNRHIVAVVIGGRTGASRDAQMRKLIASFLPKASRGKRTAPLLVARSSNKQVFKAAAMARAPLPDMKPDLNQPIVTASIPIPPRAAPAPVVKTTATANGSRMVKTLAITPNAPIPSAPIPNVASTESETITVAANNSADPQPSWQVQIAAAETEDKAVSMLRKAQGKVGGDLRGRVPYTEPVNTGGTTLYRARFVGFDTKVAARNACATLKKANFNCYAVYQ